MGYNSVNTFVFPCVSRDGSKVDDLSAKLMSEENITNLIKSITDNHSYIISYNDDSEELEFILDGYYFKLSNFTPNGTLYATLVYNDSSGLKLIKGDEATGFEGLSIDTTPTTDKPCLLLCENGKISEVSKIKFLQSSLTISTINCGVLN